VQWWCCRQPGHRECVDTYTWDMLCLRQVYRLHPPPPL